MTAALPVGSSVEQLVACAAGEGVDLFLTTADGEVWHRSGGAYPRWASLGLVAAPSAFFAPLRLSAASPAEGEIELVARHSGDGQRWQNRLDHDAWSGWAPLPPRDEQLVPDETAAVRSPNPVSVTSGGAVRYRSAGRSEDEDLGGFIASPLHVASVARGGIVDVFAIWAGAALLERSFRGEWTAWKLLDVLRADAGSYAVLRGADLVSLTVRGSGLSEQSGAGGQSELIAARGRGTLIVDLPPQHIAETELTSGESSSARLAGPSSLHFKVASQRIPLSVTGVLHAMGTLEVLTEPRGAATTLELPWRLLMALHAGAGCRHSDVPGSGADGVTALWHTRMLDPNGSYVAVHPFASLPSTESTFVAQTTLGDTVSDIAAAGASDPENAMGVERLILSACGAWFSGSFAPASVDWTHRASMGRDYYVRVVQRGVIFPFGHRAAVVHVIERRFETAGPATAGLRRSTALVILQRSCDYRVEEPHERAFPFQRIEIQPVMLSPVDDPGRARTFWPTRDGRPIVFSVRGTAGEKVIEMQLPLVFTDGAATASLDNYFALGPPGAGAAGRPTALVGRFMPLAMKSATEPLEGAEQQVRSLAFGATLIPGGPGFHPKITGLEVELPAVSQLLGAPGPVPATLSRELLQWTPGDAAPDVLLEFPKRTLDFSSAKAGVVAAPNIAVDRVSRTRGPVPAVAPVNPDDLFGPGAKLLGVVPLREIVRRLDRPPEITWVREPVAVAKLHWDQRLEASHDYAGPFVPDTGSTVTLTVEAQIGPNPPPGKAPVGPRPLVVNTDGTITNFSVYIPAKSAFLAKLKFAALKFHAETGEIPAVAVDIATVELGGSLKFIQALGQYIPGIGTSGPKVEITPDQIHVAYAIAIPTPLAVGVFTVDNLLLQAGITLSLKNQPVTIDFSFGSRSSPFLVTVTGLGGGGYIEMGFGAGGADGGLQRFVGGIEFGASVAMNFGVAAGEVHVFGGVVFAKQGADVRITGYLRIGGMVRVLGLVSVSIELTVSLSYVPAPANELHGSAKLVVAIDLTFWSTSVEIECEKSFKGSDLLRIGPRSVVAAAPRASVEESLGPVGTSFPWQTYCRAFGAV